jgi:pimeloyl-ACP methyl ester carboxylesterase
MAYISVRGVEHYYQWIPEVRTPGKPVMVFIHGWGGSASYWQDTAIALSADFDCLLYDLRGFGRSKLPRLPISKNNQDNNPAHNQGNQDNTQDTGEISYDLEEYAIDLNLLLDQLGLGEVYLNGHSVGASIATLFLRMYGDRVKQAILTCSGIFTYEAKSFAAFHQFGGYVVKFRPQWFLSIPFAGQMFMARFLHKPLPESINKKFLADFLAADYEAALGTIYTSVSQHASEVMPQAFAQIQIPTLLVAGEKDIIIPAAMGKNASSLSPYIEYYEIPATAHFPMLEAPEIYLAKVRDFLNIGEKSKPAETSTN